MQQSILYPYTLGFISYVAALLSLIYGRLRLCTWFHALAVASMGVSLASLGYTSGHWPVFNFFETLVAGAFALGVLGLLGPDGEDRLFSPRLFILMEILILLLITLFLAKEPSPFHYYYDYPYIILFHGFRILALVVMLTSSAHFIDFKLQKRGRALEKTRLHQGRNFLVLAALFFLLSEYVGILWCQNGWGDIWHWNGAFFQSTLLVLFLMLAFHIPGRNRDSEGIRSLLGGLSGFFMLALMIIRSLR